MEQRLVHLQVVAFILNIEKQIFKKCHFSFYFIIAILWRFLTCYLTGSTVHCYHNIFKYIMVPTSECLLFETDYFRWYYWGSFRPCYAIWSWLITRCGIKDQVRICSTFVQSQNKDAWYTSLTFHIIWPIFESSPCLP